MRKPKALPSELQAVPFSIVDAHDRGVSISRLRASDLETPIRGVRRPSPRDSSFRESLTTYKIHMAADEFLSHVTAAQLYEIPLPRTLQNAQAVHVSVHFPAFPPRVRGITGHRLSVPIQPREHRTFRVVSPERTFTQLAAVLTLPELVIVGDFLVGRKHPLSTLQKLAAAVTSMGPARGVRMARLALPLIRTGTDSPMETLTRLLIVNAGLPEPVIGYTVRDRNGDFVATPDLSYVVERIAIEYEGSDHQTNPLVYAEDIERRALLEAAGWFIILIIKTHIYTSPHWTTERIRTALRERADLRLAS